jgi:hypothetical protein
MSALPCGDWVAASSDYIITFRNAIPCDILTSTELSYKEVELGSKKEVSMEELSSLT